jgi:hypothetical protein
MNRSQHDSRVKSFQPRVSQEELDRMWRLKEEEEMQMRLLEFLKIQTRDENVNATARSTGEGNEGGNGGAGKEKK